MIWAMVHEKVRPFKHFLFGNFKKSIYFDLWTQSSPTKRHVGSGNEIVKLRCKDRGRGERLGGLQSPPPHPNLSKSVFWGNRRNFGQRVFTCKTFPFVSRNYNVT